METKHSPEATKTKASPVSPYITPSSKSDDSTSGLSCDSNVTNSSSSIPSGNSGRSRNANTVAVREDGSVGVMGSTCADARSFISLHSSNVSKIYENHNSNQNSSKTITSAKAPYCFGNIAEITDNLLHSDVESSEQMTNCKWIKSPKAFPIQTHAIKEDKTCPKGVHATSSYGFSTSRYIERSNNRMSKSRHDNRAENRRDSRLVHSAARKNLRLKRRPSLLAVLKGRGTQGKRSDCNVEILYKIRELYGCRDALSEDESDATMDLTSIGDALGTKLSHINYRATVMVVGNVSAGKSTFINWYADDLIQKTGMAIETNSFTIITSGVRSNELSIEPSMLISPQYKCLIEKHPSAAPFINTKTVPRKRRSSRGSFASGVPIGVRHGLIDLIDTPGLADGDVQYPFDVASVIVDMAEYVDLILVFFEPLSQALGTRLMNVVSLLYKRYPSKLILCVTKMDEIATEDERIKVMCQTTQSITARLGSIHAFDILPIYIPGAKNGTYLCPSASSDSSLGGSSEDDEPLQTARTGLPCQVNRLHELVGECNKLIDKKVQENLQALRKNCHTLSERIEYLAQANEENVSLNRKQLSKVWVFRTIQMTLLLLLLVVLAVHLSSVFELPLGTVFLMEAARRLPLTQAVVNRLEYISAVVPQYTNGIYFAYALLASWMGIIYIITCKIKRYETLSREGLALLESRRVFLKNATRRWHCIYRQYLSQSSVEES